MNIKTRLSKIEEKLNINSDFCNCERDLVIKVRTAEEREQEPERICEKCLKPIDTLRFTFNFNNNIEMNVIEPTVNFTREEFEDWQNKHVISQHQTYEERLAEKERYENQKQNYKN